MEAKEVKISEEDIENYAHIHKNIVTYNASWNTYGIGCSWKNKTKIKVGLGSFKESQENEIEILEFNCSENTFQKIFSISQFYPATKIMWIPDPDQKQLDLMASSSDSLKVWESTNKGEFKFKLKTELKSNSDSTLNAPLTSFDWNTQNPSLLGTSSIDSICTLFDLEKNCPISKLIAHEKEVYDFSFHKGEQLFATAGGDASIRTFDRRNLMHSIIAYENNNSLPFLRVSWSRENDNLLASFMLNSCEIIIVDLRFPNLPYEKIHGHEANINSIAWAASSGLHLCSCGDDGKTLIYMLESESDTYSSNSFIGPFLGYDILEPISNMIWPIQFEDRIFITFDNRLQILKL